MRRVRISVKQSQDELREKQAYMLGWREAENHYLEKLNKALADLAKRNESITTLLEQRSVLVDVHKRHVAEQRQTIYSLQAALNDARNQVQHTKEFYKEFDQVMKYAVARGYQSRGSYGKPAYTNMDAKHTNPANAFKKVKRS